MDEERKQVERGMQPLLTMDGMLFLAPGGMSTRRSGLRLFMPRFMGGGDLVCMFLFMPPGETSRPGELRWFPYPFPKREHRKKAEKHLIHQCSPLVFLGRRTYMLLNLCHLLAHRPEEKTCKWCFMEAVHTAGGADVQFSSSLPVFRAHTTAPHPKTLLPSLKAILFPFQPTNLTETSNFG